MSDLTTTQVLRGYLVALSQGCFTFWHILYCLASIFSDWLARLSIIHAYANLMGKTVSLHRQPFLYHFLSLLTILTLLFTMKCEVWWLTCPLNSIHHLESARDRQKQSKEEYHQILSELDSLGVPIV